jgi:endonuclease/exonuclease/phosphatase family metal-dependent hydrolase
MRTPPLPSGALSPFRLVSLRFLLVLSLLAGVFVSTGCPRDTRPEPSEVTVVSYNLYLGADISELLTAPADELPLVAARLFQNVQETDFPTRATAIAALIERENPALIGLQEVSLYRTQTPSDFVTGVTEPNATDVALDFLTILLARLQERGLAYRPVAITTNADVEVPASTDGATFTDIRLTDRDVILARDDVTVAHAVEANFTAALTVSIGGHTIDFLRGYNSVVATVHGRTFTFANTHLEVDDGNPQGAARAQFAQALELLAALQDRPLPLLLVGDFNSPADGSGTVIPELGRHTYGLLTETHTDALTEAGVDGPTCCQGSELRNPTSTLRRRIDLILHRGGAEARSADILGDEPEDRVDDLWPSDHAGVSATLRLPARASSAGRP